KLKARILRVLQISLENTSMVLRTEIKTHADNRGISIFLGHNSALEYWRLHERNPFLSPTRACIEQSATQGYKTLDTGALERIGIINQPIHLVVSNAGQRRRSKSLKPHVMSQHLPDRCFLKVASGIYVSTPELCFLQMAETLSLSKLIELGFELCGYYGKDPHGESRPLVKLQPRTTPARIKTLLNRCSGVPGVLNAKRAIGYVLADFASPMETILAMLLCLPQNLGGYGLPRPKMNHHVSTQNPKPASANVSGLYGFWCDLCWPEQKFALEYDSDAFHAGSEKLNKDSRRRTLIELEDYHVLSVTKKQLYDQAAFDELAQACAKSLEFRLRIRNQRFHSNKYKLRKELLFERCRQTEWVGPQG
ncbi:MAG: hypothetical protein Q4F23_06070, partial [Coriobacteriia bacterium]|nr:hypothetical protein [Coriobacteriia bacterium]